MKPNLIMPVFVYILNLGVCLRRSRKVLPKQPCTLKIYECYAMSGNTFMICGWTVNRLWVNVYGKKKNLRNVVSDFRIINDWRLFIIIRNKEMWMKRR